MQILGIGVDIVSNLRIKKSIKNNSFINRVFSKSEIRQSKKNKINLIIFQRDSQLKKHL